MSTEKRHSPADRALLVASSLAILVLAVCAVPIQLESWRFEREIDFARASGWLACGALLLSLTMSPLGRLVVRLSSGRVRMGAFIAYRRAFGIVSAAAASIHAVAVLGTYLWNSWAAVIDRAYLRSGLLAWIILLVLLATSFPRLNRALELRGWKELHRLAYVAGALALHHLLLSPFASRSWTLGLFGFCLLLAPLRWLGKPGPSKESRSTNAATEPSRHSN